MYVGCWHDKNRLRAFRVGPDIAAINLEFPGKSRDEFPAEVLIQAVIDSGKKHPEHWATEAQDDDPGSKLAFLVTLSHGPRFVHSLGEGAARKANTLVDCMIGDTIESIAPRPRRHINANENDVSQEDYTAEDQVGTQEEFNIWRQAWAIGLGRDPL